ncbi:hypothetical protein T439DRAFT_352319 [Meredithblackwellia eburnea MCA 4105]
MNPNKNTYSVYSTYSTYSNREESVEALSTYGATNATGSTSGGSNRLTVVGGGGAKGLGDRLSTGSSFGRSAETLLQNQGEHEEIMKHASQLDITQLDRQVGSPSSLAPPFALNGYDTSLLDLQPRGSVYSSVAFANANGRRPSVDNLQLPYDPPLSQSQQKNFSTTPAQSRFSTSTTSLQSNVPNAQQVSARPFGSTTHLPSISDKTRWAAKAYEDRARDAEKKANRWSTMDRGRNDGDDSKKRKRIWIYGALALAVFVLALSVGLGVHFSNSKKSASNSDSPPKVGDTASVSGEGNSATPQSSVSMTLVLGSAGPSAPTISSSTPPSVVRSAVARGMPSSTIARVQASVGLGLGRRT